MKNRLLKTTLLCLMLFHYCAQGEFLSKPQTKPQIQTYTSQFEEVLEYVAKQHVTKPEYQTLVNNAIAGMLESLDPYSCYMIGEDGEEFLEKTSGSFGGIGIEMMHPNKGEIVVIAPIADLPAAKAGIKSGDKIVAVDGIKVKDLGYKAIQKIRGKAGTRVKITIARASMKHTIDYELVRVKIKDHPVKSQIDKNIGYLNIAHFTECTATELREKVNTWVREKQPLVGIILDLRNNPGGLLNQAIEVSEFFLESENIVGVKGRDDNIIMTKSDPYSNKAPKLPMVVLINQGSASASEIVAAALQDNNRAVIVGTKSFGKGTVQNLIKTMRYNAMIKVTTHLYCSPKKRFIDKKGVAPDVLVEQKNLKEETNKGKNTIAPIKTISKQLITEGDMQYKKAQEILLGDHYLEILNKKKENLLKQMQK
jgi:carboxyl-terminal processing protease